MISKESSGNCSNRAASLPRRDERNEGVVFYKGSQIIVISFNLDTRRILGLAVNGRVV